MSDQPVEETFPILALDIGGTKIGWAIVDEVEGELSIIESDAIATRANEGGPAVADRICGLVEEIHQRFPALTGIAVASAGVVNPTDGSIISATNTMPGWGGTPLGERLRASTGLPVQVLNDVHAHGLGEARLGAGRGYDTVLSIAVGTGIGGAIIHDSEVVFGSHYLAGHVGHIHHHYAPDMQCSCGRMGHIEAFCSGSGVTAWYAQRRSDSDPEARNGRELQELADSGHALALSCFTESAYALGESIGSLANTIDPSIIIMSGSMTRSGEAWWDAVAAGYASSAMSAVAPVAIVPGELSGAAPLMGAVLHYLNRRGAR